VGADPLEHAISSSPAPPGSMPAKAARSKRRLVPVFRWLHIYLSMISFATMFFFAVTGLTLNHVRWFSKQQKTVRYKGHLKAAWVRVHDQKDVPKLEIVEYLRQAHGIGGALRDFAVDSSQYVVSFKGPGYTADAFIDRETAAYDVVESRMGVAAILNDLHKGRDTGRTWSWIIDVCAVLMSFVSLTGLALILFLQRNRVSRLIALFGGAAICYLIYRVWVP
jgi:hypothetical protein